MDIAQQATGNSDVVKERGYTAADKPYVKWFILNKLIEGWMTSIGHNSAATKSIELCNGANEPHDL